MHLLFLPWLVLFLPLLAAAIALCAIPWQRKVIRGWEDSLMNWRLRRRKQNRALDLGGDEPIF